MKGIGTLINVIAIIAGGIIGVTFKKYLKQRYQETILKILGLAIIVMALGSVLSNMLVINNDLSINTQKTTLMIISLALGALIGELIDIDSKFNKLGEYIKNKSGNSNDKLFVEGFVTSSLTVCIGAMAIIGAINDGIYGDYSILLSKAILDFVIIMMTSVSLGKGCIFSFIPVGIWQFSITLLAGFIAPFISTQALSNISLVGNVLIIAVGINLIWPKTIRIANVLPAIIIAAIAAYLI